MTNLNFYINELKNDKSLIEDDIISSLKSKELFTDSGFDKLDSLLSKRRKIKIKIEALTQCWEQIMLSEDF